MRLDLIRGATIRRASKLKLEAKPQAKLHGTRSIALARQGAETYTRTGAGVEIIASGRVKIRDG